MGKERISRFLAKERNGYKYMHDRTLNLINKGYTPVEMCIRDRDYTAINVISFSLSLHLFSLCLI